MFGIIKLTLFYFIFLLNVVVCHCLLVFPVTSMYYKKMWVDYNFNSITANLWAMMRWNVLSFNLKKKYKMLTQFYIHNQTFCATSQTFWLSILNNALFLNLHVPECLTKYLPISFITAFSLLFYSPFGTFFCIKLLFIFCLYPVLLCRQSADSEFYNTEHQALHFSWWGIYLGRRY